MYWYNFTAKLFSKREEGEREGEGGKNLSWPSVELIRDYVGGVIPSSCLTLAWVLQNVLVFIQCPGCSRELAGPVTQPHIQEAPAGDLWGATLAKSGQLCQDGGGGSPPLDKLQPDIFDSWMWRCVKLVIYKIDMLKGLKAMVIAQNVIHCKYCVNFGDFNDIIMKFLMKCRKVHYCLLKAIYSVIWLQSVV